MRAKDVENPREGRLSVLNRQGVYSQEEFAYSWYFSTICAVTGRRIGRMVGVPVRAAWEKALANTRGRRLNRGKCSEIGGDFPFTLSVEEWMLYGVNPA